VRFGPLLAQLVVVRRCNLSCGYCNEFDQESAPIPAEVLRVRIDKLAELGTLAVEFTGGEPLPHPDLVELVAYASSRGFVQRKLISNAYLMSPVVVKALNRAGLTHLQVSLDGVEPNDMTVKVLKPLEKKLEHIREHAKFLVTLSAVVGAAAPDEVIQVIDFAEKSGFRPRVLLIHDGDGQLGLSAENQKLYRTVEARLGRGWRQAGNYRSRLIDFGTAPFKCRAGSRYLYIDEFGMVRWCSQTREVWGKDLLQYNSDDLREQFDTVKDCNERCTVGCARNSSKLDNWRAQGRRSKVHVHLPVV